MLQPKNLKKQRGLVWRDFTFLDFGILLGLGALALAIGLNCFDSATAQWKKLLLSAGLYVCFLPLLLKMHKYNCRMYQLLIYMFVYLFRKKKYENKDCALLVPYHSMVNPYTIKTKPLKTGTRYISVIKFVGKSPWSEEQSECDSFISKFTNQLDSIDSFITMVRIKELSDYQENLNALDFAQTWKIDQLLNNNKQVLDSYLDYYFEVKQNIELLDTNALVDNYYMVVYHSNENELKNIVNVLIDHFNNMDINADLLSNAQLLNFIAKASSVNVSTESINEYLKNYKANPKTKQNIFTKHKQPATKQQPQEQKYILDQLLKADNIIFKVNHFIKNGKYCSVQIVTDLPIQLPANWASVVFSSNAKVYWHLSAFSDNQKEILLDRSLKRIEDNTNIIKSKYKKARHSVQIDAINYLQEQLIVNQHNLFNSWLLVLNECDDLKALRKQEQANYNAARKAKVALSSLPFRQFEAYSQTKLITSENISDNMQMSSFNVANGWPFENETVNDHNFLIQGVTQNTGEPVIFDQFYKKSARRVNYNMFTLGSSGKGKSTDVKKQVLGHLAHNNKVYIIDPQNEYAKFGRLYGANVVDFGAGFNTTFNPLEIQINLVDDEQLNTDDCLENENAFVEIVIVKHLEWLENFFMLVEPEFTTTDIMLIINTVKQLYINLGCYDIKDVNELKNLNYPIMSDLINALDQYEFRNQNEFERKHIRLRNLVDRLSYLFTDNGKFQYVYNAPTNIDLDADFIIFNTKNLSSNDKDITAQLSLFVLLSFLSNQVYKNFATTPHQNTVIVIDELHKYIGTRTQTTLDFVFDMTKTVRKFNGGMLLCTQNPGDFINASAVADRAKSILGNCQYAKFFGLRQIDLDATCQLFEASGGLNKTQRSFLFDSEIGNCLFSLHAYSKLRISTFYNDLEKVLFFDKGEIGVNYGQ